MNDLLENDLPETNFIGKPCAACKEPSEGYYGIHRDGFCDGPEVPLCNSCGKDEEPSLCELWNQIAYKQLYSEMI